MKLETPTMVFGMTEKEQKQLEQIVKLDAEMKSVDFTLSVVGALIKDMAEDLHEVEMQSQLNKIMERAYESWDVPMEIMERAYGGAE